MAFPIAPLRRLNESFMDETADIRRILWYDADQYGNEQPYWYTIATVPCYRSALSGSEINLSNQMRLDVSVKVVMPFGTDVLTDDYLIIASKSYEINYIPDASPGVSASVQAFCKLGGEVTL